MAVNHNEYFRRQKELEREKENENLFKRIIEKL
jgi:hypothetical protein